MSNEDIRRIADVVENDLGGSIKTTLCVARSDICAVLAEFCDVRKIGMSVQSVDGNYKLIIEADITRFYEVGKITESPI